MSKGISEVPTQKNGLNSANCIKQALRKDRIIFIQVEIFSQNVTIFRHDSLFQKMELVMLLMYGNKV